MSIRVQIKHVVTCTGLVLGLSAAWTITDGARAESSPSSSATSPASQEAAMAVLETYCYKCHGPDEQKGKVRLDTLDPDFIKGVNAEDWHDVLDAINFGDMPPKKEKQPQDAERRALVSWITGELKRKKEAQTTIAGKALLRRMNRDEYQNTMTDLLGVKLNFAENLPPDSKSKDGFTNNGMSLGMSPMQMEYYLMAARDALAEVIVEGKQPASYKEANLKHGDMKLNRAARFKVSHGELVLPGHAYYATLKSYPFEGLAQIKVKLEDVKVPQGQGYPQVLIGIGTRLSAGGSIQDLYRANVVPGDGGQAEVVFTGRMEDVQLPESGSSITVVVANDYKTDAEFERRLSAHFNAKKQFESYEKRVEKAKKQGKPIPEKPSGEFPELPPAPSYRVKSVSFEGPIFESWPPPYHHQILFERPSGMAEAEYAKQVITRFIDRAYRRPVTDADVAPVFDFYQKIRPQMPSLESAIRDALALVLISPDFLYLIEPASEAGGSVALTNHERASRLSYLLWGTMPDDQLRSAADKGLLSNPAEMEKQARRMLEDPRSEVFVESFTSQWLDLSGVDRVAINPIYYPDFDENIKEDLRRETIAFFGELLRHDLSAMNLIDSDFVVINRTLAMHYGLPAPKGASFERVPLQGDKRRGGLLTQGSVLMMNSDGEDSHPIRRAVWIRQRLLDDPPDEPPADVPELNKEDPNFASLPLKRQLELHRDVASCRDCHARLDPWGIPMENYDAVGAWREKIIRKVDEKTVTSDVVSDSALPTGQQVNGIEDLKKVLSTDLRQKFSKGFVRYILAYSLSRSLDATDLDDVNRLLASFEKSDYQIDELLVEIVKSKSFNSK